MLATVPNMGHNGADPEMTLSLETARFDALRKLAAERFGTIEPAEEEVLRLSASTEDLDTPESKDRPKVRAAFVRWLATDKDAAAHIDPLGLRVANATIASDLDLSFCKLPFPLRLRRCTLRGKLDIGSAELPALDLSDCTTEQGVTADGLRTRGTVFLRGLEAKGEVRFPGARIGGDLDCSRATLTAEGDALSADGAKIAGGVFLREKFSCSGSIRFLGVKIGGDLDCTGAALTAEGEALSADGANITGDVFLREGFSSSGTIGLLGAQIGGDLDCSGARMGAMTGEQLRLEGKLIWTGIKDACISRLDLLGASVKTLRDDAASWPAPGKLVVKGLEYGDLADHELSTDENLSRSRMAPQRPLRARERIRWLSLQDDEDRLDPQAWMWLAKLFKEKGQDGDSRRVLLSYRLMQARAGKWYMWPIHVPFGFLSWEPLLILLPFVLFFFWGANTYQRAWDQGQISPTASDAFIQKPAGASPTQASQYAHAYPVFNPWIYTLENELPLVKFGMDDKWAPDPNLIARGEAATYWGLAVFRWFLILAGWVQGILLTFGITRRFRD